MSKRILPSSLLPLLLIILISCDFGDLQMTVRFNQLTDLKEGDRIIYQKGYVGDVEKISETNNSQYLVELDIDKDHKNNITDLSIFYIANDPDLPGRKAVYTEQQESGGIPLVDGSVLVGLDHPPLLRHMLDDLGRKAKELGAGLADQVTERLMEVQTEIERGLKEQEEAIRTAPGSAEVEELTRNIEKLISELEKTLEQVKNFISVDLLNALRDSLESFHKRLDKIGTDERNSPAKQGEKELGKPRTDRHMVTVSNTESGFVGVSFNEERNRYGVSWVDKAGKQQKTSVSVKKHGKKKAFKLACEMRARKDAERLGTT